MDPRLTRALVGVLLIAGLALAAREAPAQLTQQPSAGPPPPDSMPPPPAPLNIPQTPLGPPPPPPVATPRSPVSAPSAANATNAATNTVAAPAPPRVAKPPPLPPGPPLPIRAPIAVMQVLDKITAETLQFEAPVGRPIRYKTLVMTVRVCETRGASDPQPRPSAYVVMDTRAVAVPGHEPPPPKRVFDGWMFANAPALHPLEHPIYDAWLVSCSAGTPVAPPTPPPAVSVPAKAPEGKSTPPSPSSSVPVKVPAAKSPPPPPPDSVPPTTPEDNSSTPPQ